MAASNHSIPSPPAAAPFNGTTGFMPHRRPNMMMHMTFVWGNSAEVLFTGWPGHDNPGMYALSLVFVFVLAVVVEWLSHSRFIKPGTNGSGSGVLRTCLYTVRTGLLYMAMLAVMSFNVGIFLATVAGHGIGFLVFGSRVFKKWGGSGGHLPSMTCG